MKNIFAAIIGVALCGSLATAGQTDSIICHISGKVIDRPQSHTAILYEAGQDSRLTGIKIPIENGEYSYILHSDYPQQYEVSFDDEIASGCWLTRKFFSGNGSVEIISYPEEKDTIDTVISTLPDNILQNTWWDRHCNEYLKQLHEIFNALDSLPKGSAEYEALIQEKDIVLAKQNDMLKAMIAEKPTVFGLAKIRDKMLWSRNRKGLEDYIDFLTNFIGTRCLTIPIPKRLPNILR